MTVESGYRLFVDGPMQPQLPARGRYSTDKEALAALIDSLVAAMHPREIWLFGSRARGDHTEYSDWDLFLTFDGALEERDYCRAYEAAAATALPCDLMLCDAREFVDYRDVAGSLSEIVAREGHRVYQRPES